ncbi:MAG: LptF/LptG family permease [Candidatus Kapabacteria bacterium]|jgi:lipopolysaccharide export system permease protein|nr:LptF/LptG family permease [Candidatus Kapabacteria bacterium]
MSNIIKKLDWYVVRQFMMTLLFGMLGLCILFVIVHLLENLDGFLDRKTPPQHIALFYLNYLPEIIKLTTPVAMLLSSLFTMGRFSTLNELTAMKAGGLSLYRILLPLLVIGLIISGGQFYFDGWVVPRANRFKAEFERKALGKGRVETTVYNVYMRDTPQRNLIIGFYDDVTKTGSNWRLEEYSSEKQPRLVWRIYAGTCNYDTVKNLWQLTNVSEHRFNPDFRVHPTVSIQPSVTLKTNTTPRLLMQFQRNTNEMTFPELREYIDASERGGKDVRQQRIAYWGEHILPFANFIVMLFGIPISGGQRKAGLALEISMAIVIAFLYIACIRIGQTLGLAGDMPPALAAAAPHCVFLLAGMANLLRART